MYFVALATDYDGTLAHYELKDPTWYETAS